ncbi:hypothetical protein Psch_03214 [Pelotomaculum schinkii]|uniref:Uncharacterized protein n=1 Tax=Pelotomaculum schinkii TaxID=78350 RepID=A0A4Y7RBS7_9FIRM|nr:hypothetical protein Psch_03214 [Pelotomaculum schinkii]
MARKGHGFEMPALRPFFSGPAGETYNLKFGLPRDERQAMKGRIRGLRPNRTHTRQCRVVQDFLS